MQHGPNGWTTVAQKNLIENLEESLNKRSWRDDSVVKPVYCFCRNTQIQFSDSQPPVAAAQSNMSSSDTCTPVHKSTSVYT